MPTASAKASYPTKAKVEFAIRMARMAGIEEVGGLEIGPDGTIRVLAKNTPGIDSAYDRWKAGSNKG